MDAPTPGRRTRQQVADAAQQEHRRRHQLALRLAEPHDGVVTVQQLLGAGLTRGQIRTEVDRGAWHRAGYRTLSVASVTPMGNGLLWRALWESGGRSVLDGATALIVAGLRGWTEDVIHVSVPNNATVRRIVGVQHHRIRTIGPVTGAGLRRTRPEVAAIRAAQWARSDRAAATLVAMTIQQRLTSPEALLEQWASVVRSPRRQALDAIIRDVCDGAHSLSELDFARLCRDRGLPEPTRQALRSGANGRVYLDVHWEDLGVHVEVQGAQHAEGLAGVDDALRLNDLALRDATLVSLQVPVLGLRTTPDRFLAQVEMALVVGRERRLSA